jgi:16S rRNA processing protein RimM
VLLVGIVRRPHGLKGEVSVELRTDFPSRFAPGVSFQWRLRDDVRSLTVRGARPHGDRMLLGFEGVEDVDAARRLSGGELSVPDEEAVAAPEGFYFGHELEGWRCETTTGELAGSVRRLEHTPAGPLLSLEAESGREILVPFVSPIVVLVDRASRRIVIDPPAGLLEL